MYYVCNLLKEDEKKNTEELFSVGKGVTLYQSPNNSSPNLRG